MSDKGNNATTAVVQINEVYATFKNAGFSRLLVTFLGAKFTLALINSVLNFSVVYVTARTKSLRSTCNLLIALNSLFSSTLVINQLTIFAVSLSGLNYIPLAQCIRFQSLPLFFTQCQYCTTFAIGFDRLLCVLFPFWHNAMRYPGLYMSALLLATFAYATFVVTTSFAYVQLTPNKDSMCSTSDFTESSIIASQWVINMASVCCYILLWMALKISRKIFDQSNPSTQRLLKSILMIGALELFFGWTINSAWRLLMQLLRLQQWPAWYANQLFGAILIAALALNAPILYNTSNAYEDAYRTQFPRIFARNSPSNSIGVLPNNPHPQNLASIQVPSRNGWTSGD